MTFAAGERVVVETFGNRRMEGSVVYDRGGNRVRVRFDSGREQNAERNRVFPKKPASRVVDGSALPPFVVAPAAPKALRLVHARAALTAVEKPAPPVRSKVYLDFVRAHACQNCGAPAPSEAAHHGPRGISQKTDDYRCNALCTTCHAYWHQHGVLPVASRFGEIEGWTRGQSESFLYGWQVDLLVEWLRKRERS